jgi:hypothetical protein
MTHDITTLCIKILIIMIPDITTLCIKTLCIITLNITTLNTRTYHDTFSKTALRIRPFRIKSVYNNEKVTNGITLLLC